MVNRNVHTEPGAASDRGARAGTGAAAASATGATSATSATAAARNAAGASLHRPAQATCRTWLADGRVASITASVRPRANRADVKCAAPGAPAMAARMQEVVRLARHTETGFDSRDQVVLSIDIAPRADERGWELAAVLADRMARGTWRPARPTVAAHGWSDAWHLGSPVAADGRAINSLLQALPDAIVAHGMPEGVTEAGMGAAALPLPHLGALTGHTDPSRAIASARAWFPLHSGGVHDSLAWVEVSVAPWPPGLAAGEEEDSISVPGLNVAGQLAVRQVLAGARHFDGRALGRWRTVVRFSETRFQGNSYELALVMADRLARGREFVPRGRLIATGCSAAWHTGRVEPVQGVAAKLDLIAAQAGPGDRILLPEGNIEDADAAPVTVIRKRGATLARIARIGMI